MQAVFNSIRGFVYDISQLRPPKFDSTSVSPFLMSVQAKLARFARHCVLDSKAKPQTLYGLIAVEHILASVKADNDTDTAVTYQRLQPLHVFGWLLKEPDRKMVLGWTNAIIASQAIVAPTAASSSSKKGGSKPKGGETKAMVSALFV
jgi:hypothetical protein